MKKTRTTAVFALAFASFACGRSDLVADLLVDPSPEGSLETCDGLDNDLDGEVDEDFRDDAGYYTHTSHCGACQSPCAADDVTMEVDCLVVDGAPRCVATSCLEGYVVSRAHTCVSWSAQLCKPCIHDLECGDFDGAVCANVFGEPRCAVACVDGGCPADYSCNDDELCVPPSGSCECAPGDSFSVFCEIALEEGICIGTATCDDGVLSACAGVAEVCDGVDNDCDGVADDPWVNDLGGYSVDIHNCGACGIDCTENPIPDHDLICGGPLTDPVCAMLCDDTLDGLQVGDHVDADLSVATGCECQIQSLDDPAGPALGGAYDIDVNCDGADGVVNRSYYVSPDGDDEDPGSPSSPMASVTAAVEAAFESLSSAGPRPHVFVSAGSYSEVLVLREGVFVHGGYDPDFLALDPASYVTEIRAPAWTSDFGGAALVANGVGVDAATLVEGFRFVGAAAASSGDPSFGGYLSGCGGLLTVRDCAIESADGVDGPDGADGASGAFASGAGEDGALPRAAVENASHACTTSSSNVVAGGAGQSLFCAGIDVGGGDGGDARCPGGSSTWQEAGSDGSGPAGTPGGDGGSGGWDARGPMYEDEGCPFPVCCGLAHFIVSYDYEVAEDGAAGNNGQSGGGGAGCVDPLGELAGAEWSGESAAFGTAGKAGSGGGGGGAGGGALIEWSTSYCAFPDGLGGGGGGGGAGGCGGAGGQPGLSGGPTIGLAVVFGGSTPPPSSTPVIEGVAISTGDGGRGGRGGTGGNGGLGAPGGIGGALEPEDKTTPTLAGPSSGGHGGHGGAGGGGGGGGGGCGGSVVGIWLITGTASYPGAAAEYAAMNDFSLGDPGLGGDGGFGGTPGGDGEDGEANHVVEM